MLIHLWVTTFISQRIYVGVCILVFSSTKNEDASTRGEENDDICGACRETNDDMPEVHEDRDRNVHDPMILEIAELLLGLSSSASEVKEKSVSTQTVNVVEIPAYQPNRLLENIRTRKQLTSLTGIDTFKGFDALCDAVSLYEESEDGEKKKSCMTVRSRVLMTLMKLKTSLSFVALSVFFDTSRDILSTEFKRTIRNMRYVLEPCIIWPSRESVDENMPRCFALFTSTRVVLDCTEAPVFTFKCLKCRRQTYSHYKGRHTLKFLVGNAPSGLLTFVSGLYGGTASDKFIFNDSGLIDLLESRDAVMVDRGFFIEEECSQKDVRIIRPAFLPTGESQLPREDAEYSRQVASARVHIERCMERLKNFDIFHKEIPSHLLGVMPDVVIVICGLYNLSSPILSDERF